MTELHLVTGGSGYFGNVMVRRLLADGHRVRIFDLHAAGDIPDDAEVVTGDIRDGAAVGRAMRGVDVVHHNVAQVPLAKDKELFWTVNRDGVRVMLHEALRAEVAKVVYVSSSAVFGRPKHNPVTEQTAPTPGEDYGRAKLAGEKLCLEFAAKGLDCAVIRPRTIMGPGRLGIMQVMFEWIFQGKNVPVLGRGDNRYQFVHADDLAEACVLAAAKRQSGAVATFNIGAEEFGTMRQTLEGLAKHAGTGTSVRSLPKSPAVIGMRATDRLGFSPLGAYHALMYGEEMYFDVSKAKRELGWAAQYSNAEMFAASYDWYVQNRQQVLASQGGSHHRSPVRQGILKLVSWAL